MTTTEFSNAFDTLVSSYRRFKDFDKRELLDSLEFDEYEKSLYLTLAQEELVVNLYSGKNVYGESFELTEEMRRYLDELVKTKTYGTADQVSGRKISSSSKLFELPEDLAFIVHEHIVFEDCSLGCCDGASANVYPVTHDEYNKIANNPFRGATKYKALRLDCGNNIVEIISKYSFGVYFMRYISKPQPIILEDLPNGITIDGLDVQTECELDSFLHQTILKRAVQMALASKGINVES